MNNNIFSIFAEESKSEFSEKIASAVSLIVPPPYNHFLSIGTKVLSKWTLDRVCSELSCRNVTNTQVHRMGTFLRMAVETFYRLAEKDEECMSIQNNPEGDTYYQHAYEVAENIFVTASNECQDKKLAILGRFFGKEMYKNTCNWNEIYFLTNLFKQLSYRQIIMIKLLAEFVPTRGSKNEKESKTFTFTSHATYLEFQHLLTIGLFEVGENSTGWGVIDFSSFDFSSDIYSTELTLELYDRFMLCDIEGKDVDAISKTF